MELRGASDSRLAASISGLLLLIEEMDVSLISRLKLMVLQLEVSYLIQQLIF